MPLLLKYTKSKHTHDKFCFIILKIYKIKNIQKHHNITTCNLFPKRPHERFADVHLLETSLIHTATLWSGLLVDLRKAHGALTTLAAKSLFFHNHFHRFDRSAFATITGAHIWQLLGSNGGASLTVRADTTTDEWFIFILNIKYLILITKTLLFNMNTNCSFLCMLFDINYKNKITLWYACVMFINTFNT